MINYKNELKLINLKIVKLLDSYVDNKHLLEVMTHALEGGKRLRAIIPIIIGKKKNNNLDLTKFACFIELIHNASLIIDDLPCMDNDLYRRNKKNCSS